MIILIRFNYNDIETKCKFLNPRKAIRSRKEPVPLSSQIPRSALRVLRRQRVCLSEVHTCKCRIWLNSPFSSSLFLALISIKGLRNIGVVYIVDVWMRRLCTQNMLPCAPSQRRIFDRDLSFPIFLTCLLLGSILLVSIFLDSVLSIPRLFILPIHQGSVVLCQPWNRMAEQDPSLMLWARDDIGSIWLPLAYFWLAQAWNGACLFWQAPTPTPPSSSYLQRTVNVYGSEFWLSCRNQKLPAAMPKSSEMNRPTGAMWLGVSALSSWPKNSTSVGRRRTSGHSSGFTVSL